MQIYIINNNNNKLLKTLIVIGLSVFELIVNNCYICTIKKNKWQDEET